MEKSKYVRNCKSWNHRDSNMEHLVHLRFFLANSIFKTLLIPTVHSYYSYERMVLNRFIVAGACQIAVCFSVLRNFKSVI